MNRILWGARFISVIDAKEKQHILIAKDMELEDKIWVDFIYEQALSDGHKNKLVPISELAILLEEAGLWLKSNDKEITNLRNTINKIDEALKDPEITKREKNISLRIKQAAESALSKNINKKTELFSNSLETYADSQKLHAGLFRMLYKDSNTRYWNTWEDFNLEVDNIFVNNAISEIFIYSQLTLEECREMARSAEWRFKWNAYKKSGDLFGKPLRDLTSDQESLLYWSQVYDAAYESLDRPPDSVINDDEALDAWFDEQSKKRKIDEIKRQKGSSTKVGSSKIWRHGEVGIVVNKALQGDINRAVKMGLAKETTPVMSVEEVNDLNEPLAKKLIAHQNKKIKKYGVIEERDLRSDANSRRAIGSKDAVFKRARRKDGFTGKQITDTKPGGTLQGRRN